MYGFKYGYGYGLGVYTANQYILNIDFDRTYQSLDYKTDGVELVTNGGFDTDSDWLKGIGWSISGGKATSDGTQTTNSDLRTLSTVGMTIGSYIVVTLSAEVTSGSIFVKARGNVSANITTTGDKNIIISVGSSSDYFSIVASSDFIGSVDNISVQKVIQIPNQVYSKNTGTLQDTALYSGVGYQFENGTTSIDLSAELALATSMIYRYDGVQTYTETPFDLTSSVASGVYKDVYYFSDTLSQTEIDLYSSSPNTFYNQVVDGSIDNCVLNLEYGKDGYVKNVADYSEVEILNDQFNDNSNYWILKSSTTISSGSLNFDGTLNGELARISNLGLLNHSSILVKYNLTAYTQGTLFVKIGGTSSYVLDDYTLGYKYQIIADGTLDNFQFRGESDVIASISDIEIIGLSGIYPIQNFQTANLLPNLGYGVQKANYNLDGNGFITSPSEYFEASDVFDFYGDTGWQYDGSPFEIDFITKFIDNGTSNQTLFGAYDGVNTIEIKYMHYLTRVQARLGTTDLVLNSNEKFNKAFFTLMHDGVSFRLAVNGVVTDSLSNIGSFPVSANCFLGVLNNNGVVSNPMLEAVSLFRVTGSRTGEERLEAYNDAVAKGLLE